MLTIKVGLNRYEIVKYAYLVDKALVSVAYWTGPPVHNITLASFLMHAYTWPSTWIRLPTQIDADFLSL